MKSRVYFIKVSDSDDVKVIQVKLKQLLEGSKILDFACAGDKVAVKMHFGEEGNTGYVRPEYVRLACDELKAKGAEVFIADTNTLYRGRRTNLKEHLKIAYEHGFTKENTGAQVIIADDTKENNCVDVTINQKFIQTAKIAKPFLASDAIVGIAHFKGHIMTGFGGALKNIGMGCATRKGKLAQHSDIAPVINRDNCTGCAACEKACPVKAISLEHKKAYLDASRCIGCASCIAACLYNAIDVDWDAGGSNIQEKMVEYALAVLGSKKKVAFINFAIKITKECDCLAKDDPRIAPDLGILASTDPVSIDKASFDLINRISGQDIFKHAHSNRDGSKQLEYANLLGLGSLDYELCEIPQK